MAKENPGAPLKVDTTKAVDQYMLRPERMSAFFEACFKELGGNPGRTKLGATVTCSPTASCRRATRRVGLI